ncbi:GNAT family N-acetyltransferase [Brevibacterium luteolum]|uniref:GNAT family N-acetyltransferase n=1 Tax=Brevibacterium luteolum TaxID=199591 RepID=UPI00223A7E20|nr:GNAT family N-acetyltransferase [Brevibacterium luteolum]MCT1829872.1 GNAT family N-acetyltransferase [Brevibacterium luteolum]
MLTRTASAEGVLEIVRLDPADWDAHRQVRLRMLADAPEAFWGTYEEAAQLRAADWQAQLSGARIVLHARHREQPADGETTAAEVPVGCLVLQPEGYTPDMPLAEDEAILTKIWVRPAARGRGVSAAVVREAARLSEQLGRPRLLLDVDDSNAAAIRSYERLGFRATGNGYPREGTGTRWAEYSAHASQLS